MFAACLYGVVGFVLFCIRLAATPEHKPATTQITRIFLSVGGTFAQWLLCRNPPFGLKSLSSSGIFIYLLIVRMYRYRALSEWQFPPGGFSADGGRAGYNILTKYIST